MIRLSASFFSKDSVSATEGELKKLINKANVMKTITSQVVSLLNNEAAPLPPMIALVAPVSYTHLRAHET